ncbi:MAG: NAD(P)H-hydrate epimerase [Myxococcales bacterium FL481]|nr:MAG: NAD(P)H-hydrate epimerase [Myxococcales bacterium FL481]
MNAGLWTAEQSAAADSHTMGPLGLPSLVLMERAALAVAHAVEERAGLTPTASRRVEVLCGPGNNGADGFAVARILAGRGWTVGATSCCSGGHEARQSQADWARRHGVTIRSMSELEAIASGPNLVFVDALLGTGSRGAPRGPIAAAISWLNRQRGQVVAIDVPSGVEPDTGAVPGEAVAARVTVTFQRSKPGLHISPGCSAAGRVVIADIGLVAPPSVEANVRLLTPAWAKAAARSSPAEHKGQRGHVGIVGGTGGTPGAAMLAGLAALRAGAGLVTWFTDHPPRLEPAVGRAEIMFDVLARLVERNDVSALVVGPGLTRETDLSLSQLYLEDRRPAVWDAGALARVPFDGTPAGFRCLTPHAGEAAGLMTRLRGEPWSARKVQSQRWFVATTLARRTGAQVLLKGRGTVIVDPSGRAELLPIGSDRLATAGSGDVLAGAIAAGLAGPGVPDLARVSGRAGFLHALAGELANRRRPGTVAGDIVDALCVARSVVDGDAADTTAELHGARAWLTAVLPQPYRG